MSTARWDDDDHDMGVIVATPTDIDREIEKPKMYKVVFLNDDFTPMDFVTGILRIFFGKTQSQAEAIMAEVHTKGKGIAGVFTHDIAYTKEAQVNNHSEKNGFPFKAHVEAE